ncbi:MAG: transporter substrate-binding protein [Luminiphilus sp.]|nr:transporter substrate-binding protein [Luminiphilus sp.]
MTDTSIRFVLVLTGCLFCLACQDTTAPTVGYDGEVRVGLLHSRTGTMAISEHTVAEAELLAIAEINAAGGLTIDGRQLRVVPIEEDGESDSPTFARKAAKLIDVSEVDVIFGGWTSSSRKAMLPVIESKAHLLFYPLQYEGEECSEFIFYAGATPNQQAGPAVDWLLENKGNRFFLVGSDYVYPRTANTIISRQVEEAGGVVVGEHYLPLGDRALGPAVSAIRSALPEGGIIINTINGDSNVAFFTEATAQGLTPANGYAIMSFSVSEEEVFAIGAHYLEGSFAAWNFFQAIETPASQKFTNSFKALHGIHRVTTDPAEAAYSMVHLWALAATKAGSTSPRAVRAALIGTGFDAPQGRVVVTPNHHLRKHVYIGEVQPDGQFRVVSDVGVVEPRTWSQWLPENEGYRCDWSQQRADAGRFHVDTTGSGQ